jgi:hypothetical protein
MENRAESYVSKDSLYTSVALLILTGACCVLLFMNHKLQIQNTSLIQQYRSLSGTGGPPVGTKIPTLHGDVSPNPRKFRHRCGVLPNRLTEVTSIRERI